MRKTNKNCGNGDIKMYFFYAHGEKWRNKYCVPTVCASRDREVMTILTTVERDSLEGILVCWKGANAASAERWCRGQSQASAKL